MRWLKLALELIPLIGNVIAILGKKKAEKKAKKIEQVAAAVISGVESYQKAIEMTETNGINPAPMPVKRIIEQTAVVKGVETKLNELVCKYTK